MRGGIYFMKAGRTICLIVVGILFAVAGCASLRPPAPEAAALAHSDDQVIPPTGHSIEADVISLIALPFFPGVSCPQ